MFMSLGAAPPPMGVKKRLIHPRPVSACQIAILSLISPFWPERRRNCCRKEHFGGKDGCVRSFVGTVMNNKKKKKTEKGNIFLILGQGANLSDIFDSRGTEERGD